MQIQSKYLSAVIDNFSQLPGIGKRTALRLALHLLRQKPQLILSFSESLKNLSENIIFCKNCHNLTDNEMCSICENPRRNGEVICIVEEIQNVIAIENTHQFKGHYHVLGGLISPMEGIGPSDLTIDSLVKRVKENDVKEVIMALSTTVEGDTTNYYLFKILSKLNVNVTTIARGVGIGDEIEYIDETTLGRSIANRLPYNNSIG